MPDFALLFPGKKKKKKKKKTSAMAIMAQRNEGAWRARSLMSSGTSAHPPSPTEQLVMASTAASIALPSPWEKVVVAVDISATAREMQYQWRSDVGALKRKSEGGQA